MWLPRTFYDLNNGRTKVYLAASQLFAGAVWYKGGKGLGGGEAWTVRQGFES